MLPCFETQSSQNDPSVRARFVWIATESQDQYLKLMANHYDWIIVATDWQGMAKYDILNALRVFTTRIGEFASIPDRTQQGWVDKVMMLRLIKPGGRLSGNSVFNMPSASDKSKVTSASFINSETKTGYYGNSQGSVIGGGYFASSVDLTHAALGVPGCPFFSFIVQIEGFWPIPRSFSNANLQSKRFKNWYKCFRAVVGCCREWWVAACNWGQ